jgi:acid phosphatase type 7
LGIWANLSKLVFCTMIAWWLCISPSVAQDPSQPPSTSPHPSSTSLSKPKAKKRASDTFVLVGAGDIAGCGDLRGAEATAKLIERISGTVFAAGDLAYEKGSYAEFMNCYAPTWGTFKGRTRPTPGNHEYNGTEGVGYFQYWGDQAGDPTKGYYSYDLGSWHIIALNTNCNLLEVGGCSEGSPEEVWLKGDLAAHPNACIVAYGHHPLFSSGLLEKHALHPELKAFWQDLYAAHADLVLAGHEHSYERFAPQNPDGQSDEKNGIREIVVGTGGRSHTFLGFGRPNSEVRNADTYGVLKLTLSPEKYKWEFIPEAGKAFHDSGSGFCHNHIPKE